MTSQELPEAGSVWRHNETGVIREVVAVDFASITFDTAGGLTRKVTTHFDWRGWKRNATRLTPSQPLDVSRLTAAEVYRLKKELANVLVFGPWEELIGGGWRRPDPESHIARAHVWERGGKYHWRVNAGEISLCSLPPGKPFPTAEEAMAACDAKLRPCKGVLLVD